MTVYCVFSSSLKTAECIISLHHRFSNTILRHYTVQQEIFEGENLHEYHNLQLPEKVFSTRFQACHTHLCNLFNIPRNTRFLLIRESFLPRKFPLYGSRSSLLYTNHCNYNFIIVPTVSATILQPSSGQQCMHKLVLKQSLNSLNGFASIGAGVAGINLGVSSGPGWLQAMVSGGRIVGGWGWWSSIFPSC